MVRLTVAVVALGGAIAGCSQQTEGEAHANRLGAEMAESAREVAAENDRSKCLTGASGSMPALVQRVRDGMRNPRSFEHIETRAAEPENSTQMVVMTYRGENGFGGLTQGSAVARVNFRTCEIINVTMN